MFHAAVAAGPSRRLVISGPRARIRSRAPQIASRRLIRSSSSSHHQTGAKADDAIPLSSPDATAGDDKARNDDTSESHTTSNLDSSPSDLKDQPFANPPLPKNPPSPIPETTRPSTTSSTSSIPWQIPPAWKSQLDPDAPWRRSLLESRRRWLEQAGHQLTAVGLKLNEVTGYKEVERLKEDVNAKEIRLKWLREDAKTAKEEYERAVSTRATSQSDVNSLLERKHTWSDEDVSRFTQLVRSDHLSNQAVSTTSLTLKETELGVDRAFNELMQAILQRYHEEQVWSDKIRNVSTYANLLGLLINLVVFVGAIAFVEPWKRRRLVERLEERMAGMMDRVEGSIGLLGETVANDLKSIREEAQTYAGISPPIDQSGATAANTNDTPTTSVSGTDIFNLDEQDQILSGPHTPNRVSATIAQAMETLHLSTMLDKVAPPSHDRDVIFSASVGTVAGIAITALGMWLGR